MASISALSSGFGQRFADERSFPEVPDGKILTRHLARFVSSHLAVLRLSREAGTSNPAPDLFFFLVCLIEMFEKMQL